MSRPTPLAYIMQELRKPDVPFTSEWGKLSDTDRKQLQEWATQEMDALNVTAPSVK